jgi:hypothetical protein
MRGQIWSLDVIFALVIFSFTVTLLTLTWLSVSNQLAVSYAGSSGLMAMQARSFSDIIMSPGSPADWYEMINTTNKDTWGAVSPGITYPGNGSISQAKLLALVSMANSNYQATKPEFGLGYDYYIAIHSGLQYQNYVNLSIGRNPASNNALTVYVDRESSMINGVPVVVEVMVWSNSTGGLT